MIRVYQFVGKGAYIHCFDCGKNFEISEEEASQELELIKCPACSED